MPANRLQLQNALHKPYDRLLFAKEILSPVFGNGFSLYANEIIAPTILNQAESIVIDKVSIFGNIRLDDNTEIICYEIVLQPTVRLEHSKVAIQQYVRKLLTAGQAALVNFIAPINKDVWRLTLIAKDSVLTDSGIKEKTTNSKRYTYLLGPNETCKTAAERFEILSTERSIEFGALIKAFSVEKLSKAFFDEYTLHYSNFINYLSKETNFIKSYFKNDDKAVRDFTKKLLGRIVFLYFVQKKGWLGASSKEYYDGDKNFIFSLFAKSGGDETFYPNWLSVLFFETLNQNETQNRKRKNDDFEMPDGTFVKIPFLNGGLFDKEAHDNYTLTFKPLLFHNPDNEDDPKHRGFLDFLNSFNFTVFEDSPDDHTVAVDPEMLGHIFENLLEYNKDTGAFYTPKEIVHYMCQESIIEYLSTHLSTKSTLNYEPLDLAKISAIVKNKNVHACSNQQIQNIDKLLDVVKICDPAIGSGAFPMGLLQEIFAIKELIAYETQKKWNPADVKGDIIQNSIYGVDIEKGAVDIARLRFWLSLIVDEPKPKALPNLDYKIVVGNSLVSKFNDEVIDIDWNIKSKNVSAVEKIIADQQSKLKLLETKQANYFKASGQKNQLKKDIEKLKATVLLNQLNLTKISFEQSNPKLGGFAPTAKDLKKNLDNLIVENNLSNSIKILSNFTGEEPLDFFDWKLNFPEVLNEKITQHVGFDIVIGNPPYVGEKGNKEKFHQIKLGFMKDFYLAKMDLFYFFFHLAIKLCKAGGTTNFITTNYFPTADGAFKLREQIKNDTTVLSVINFNEFKVFDSALGQHNMITFLKKQVSKNPTRITNVNRKNETGAEILRNILNGTDSKSNYADFELDQLFDGPKLYLRIGHIGPDNYEGIFKQISSNSDTLEKLASINSGCDITISRITDKHIEQFPTNNYVKGKGVFVLSKKEIDILKSQLTDYELRLVKPYIKNSNIHKYDHSFSEDFLLYIGWNIPESKIPNLIQYLKPYKPILDDQILRYDEPNWPWYSLHRPREAKIFESSAKIIAPYRSNSNTFALAKDPVYSSRDVFYISLLENNISNLTIEALVAILNSKLVYFWLYNRGKRKGETLELYYTPLSEIPICKISNVEELSFFVQSIIFLKSQALLSVNEQLMPVYFEQVINGIVYELYFPELIAKNRREIIKNIGTLPSLNNLDDEEKLNRIVSVFDRMNDKEHPVRVNLFYMSSILEIAIIEGKQ
ncbi:Eco57I restriction-modification methylase domain-containing protein [Mucilaginibacter gilvus]|uniref:site-specific DNA-methyltransferase (adenine-specific) n=1 Tax=Mucilaginibacter gilvus TaxID=2305909 RepID=A0A3S3V422_9SPHI|nr:TaqI-like C-terminal specificity domain-containing protein [Mucilaginibacter gilvus]RWY57533.1 hypothetical protein EPL05_03110 [Mucilaginibacter gilvus]